MTIMPKSVWLITTGLGLLLFSSVFAVAFGAANISLMDVLHTLFQSGHVSEIKQRQKDQDKKLDRILEEVRKLD